MLKVISRTPLADFFIVKLLQEVGEDYLSSKLLDIYTYNRLLHVICDTLFSKYPQISLALTSDDIVPSTLYLQKNIKEKIQSLIIYRRYPEMVMQNLEKIIGVSYRFNNGAQIIDIADEFTDYLLSEQEKTNDVKFIDKYIYEYESI